MTSRAAGVDDADRVLGDAGQGGWLPGFPEPAGPGGHEHHGEPRGAARHEAWPALPDRAGLGAAHGRGAPFPGRSRDRGVLGRSTAAARRPRRRATRRARPSARGRRGPRRSAPSPRPGRARSTRPAPHRRRPAAMIREAMATAMPVTLAPICSTSPTWTPARISMPELAHPAAHASSTHSTAAAGASKMAKKPSPAVSISRPPMPPQRRADRRVMELDQLAPGAVAELGGVLGRSPRCRSSRPSSGSVRGSPRPVGHGGAE